MNVWIASYFGASARGCSRYSSAPQRPHLLGALQFTTAIVALFVPLAAAIYLATTVVWTLVQRVILRRRYPLAAP